MFLSVKKIRMILGVDGHAFSKNEESKFTNHASTNDCIGSSELAGDSNII